MMWIFKRKKKKKRKTVYIRNDETEDYREKVREAFGSVKYEDVDIKTIGVDVGGKCMAMTKRGTRCKNKALEDEDYCYRHKALYG